MQVRSFTLSLMATLCLIAIPLFADKYKDRQEDYCLEGTGKITKDQSIVKAHADGRATTSAESGWYWVHARVLPYDEEYSEVYTDEIMGYVYVSAYVTRGGYPKDNGRSYVSMWAAIGDEYYDIDIDLPQSDDN